MKEYIIKYNNIDIKLNVYSKFVNAKIVVHDYDYSQIDIHDHKKFDLYINGKNKSLMQKVSSKGNFVLITDNFNLTTNQLPKIIPFIYKHNGIFISLTLYTDCLKWSTPINSSQEHNTIQLGYVKNKYNIDYSDTNIMHPFSGGSCIPK